MSACIVAGLVGLWLGGTLGFATAAALAAGANADRHHDN